MSRTPGKAKVVLRRRFDSTFSFLGVVGSVVATTCALLTPFPEHQFIDQLEFVAAMAPLTWFIWMVGAHPVVKVYESGVLVVNWFRRYWIPWSELASVESTDEVNLVLVSGERIGVASGASSVAGSLMGNRPQDRIRVAVENSRPHPVPLGSGGVVRRLDLCPRHFVALVGYLVIVAWSGVLR
ncbi:PH domain-containing protein [Lentzea sp. DG1S-22]|uniref:PH domain-containing protein n=1 Tax=Lentzea sp. DG1S-22 TaxID=3108822 RepID=UPI002E777E3A|nr:PH domain-containing protein [Lentzea sp. DG1S-22]WVH82964.1 PH domain-containing protein [Lentzea sp. DG1S-22]